MADPTGVVATATGATTFLSSTGWMGLFVLAVIGIIVGIVWFFRYERPARAKDYKANEDYLKDIIAKYEKKTGKMSARLKDVYDNLGGQEAAIQRLADLIMTGKIDVRAGVRKYKRDEKDKVSYTQIIDNGD